MKRSRWDDSDEEDNAKATKSSKESSKKSKRKLEQKKPEQRVTIAPVREVLGARQYQPLAPPCRSIDNYERINFIDQGTYGLVFKARHLQSGEVFALKQVKLGAEVSKIGFPYTALREINILLTLKHPNIIDVKEVVTDPTTDSVFMVMEYCENDLKTCMKNNKQSFSIAEIKQLMIQLLSAVDYMHQKWYIHRDLKTSNLLYSNKGVLRVCDFGLARKYDSPVLPYTFEVVTLWYRAPELILGSREYSTPIDLWSVGCIFAEMLLGDALFPGQGEPDQISRIFKTLGAPNEVRWPGVTKLPGASKISWRLPTENRLREVFPMTGFAGNLPLSDTGLHLMNQLLTLDPSQRVTAADALLHRWLTEESPRPTAADLMPTFKSRDS